MKPLDLAISRSKSLLEFDNEEDAKKYFFDLLNSLRINFNTIFRDILKTDLSYDIGFLKYFENSIQIFLKNNGFKKYEIDKDTFEKMINVFIGDFLNKNRYGKWTVIKDNFINNKYQLGFVQANGFTYHLGLFILLEDFEKSDFNDVTIKLINKLFSIKKFNNSTLNEKLIDSINKFYDKRYSIEDPKITSSEFEIKNFNNFDLKPYLLEIQNYLNKEKNNKNKHLIYYYIKYYCWQTQDPKVCQFLINRISYEKSIQTVRKFFTSYLNEINNINSYNLDPLLKIGYESTNKNNQICLEFLKRKKPANS